jgi:hypothetical protein
LYLKLREKLNDEGVRLFLTEAHYLRVVLQSDTPFIYEKMELAIQATCSTISGHIADAMANFEPLISDCLGSTGLAGVGELSNQYNDAKQRLAHHVKY